MKDGKNQEFIHAISTNTFLNRSTQKFCKLIL